MRDCESQILTALLALGGAASLGDVYARLESVPNLLDAADLLPTMYGGRPAYQHAVRSHVTNLCQSGHLVRVSRGTYRLTEDGRRRISSSRGT